MKLHYRIFRNWQKKVALQTLCIFFISFSFAQKTNLSGRVTDGKVPLEKVSIKVLGSAQGTTTNEKGEFEIGVNKGQTLVFTYLGFEEKRMVVGSQSAIEVGLVQSAQNSLNDVVVIGYGTKKKLNVTGALSTVSAKQLEDRPITNVAEALQGTMPGVTVVQNSGQPGKDLGVIRVRGIGTLGNSDAMVVVDGVVSTLNDVNPDDIESITVLKDAASASIYGSRAANGVILVTTKKGKAGATVVHYNAYVGKQQPTRLPDYLPSWQASSFYNEALVNEGKTPRYSDAEIQKFKDGSDPDNYPNTDWLGLFYNGSGFQQNHYVDVSGGGEKTQSLLSLGYFSEDGIVKNTGLTRYSTRYKVTTKLGSRFTVNGNLAYTRTDFKEPVDGLDRGFSALIHSVNRIGNVVPYKYSNGYYGFNDEGNPIEEVNNGGLGQVTSHYLKGIVDGDLEIIKGLHFRPLLGYQLTIDQSKYYVKDMQFYDWQTGVPALYLGPNSLTDSNDFNNVITLQGVFDYNKNWGNHSFSVLAGYSQEYTHYSYLKGYRKDFLNNSLSELNAGPVAGQQATGSAYDIALESFFGRVNYEYKNKYLLEGNIRDDGSSRFASNNRWGIYPSFSAGWIISEEKFFDPLKDAVTDLKFRGSWGKLGNQNLSTIQNSSGAPIGNYPYIPTIASGQNYTFGDVVAPGISPVNGANPIIQWESTTSTDFGLDAAFLKGKITFTADYFIRNTDNLLLNIPVGSVYGFNAPVQNGGSIQNKGWEFELAYHGRANQFTYNIAANASFINNKVTDLRNTDPIITDYSFLKVGYPINSFYGYQAEGLFQTQDQVNKHATQSGGIIAPGDIMYKDQNGDGVIDGNDRVNLGSYFPKITYGLNVGMGWKGFDLTLFLQGAAQVKGLVRDVVLGQLLDETGKPTSIYVNHWTPQNPNATFPRLWNSYTQNDPDYNVSSFWVRNASYLRLKNLQVGYTISSRWLGKVGVQKARIYYSGQNIFTSTKFYNWVDPEAPAGENGSTYPQVLVNTVGINFTF
jgi:TonB-linked SusC/RagA family outer membrane protein